MEEGGLLVFNIILLFFFSKFNNIFYKYIYMNYIIMEGLVINKICVNDYINIRIMFYFWG